MKPTRYSIEFVGPAFRPALAALIAGLCAYAGASLGMGAPVWHTADQKTASGSGTTLTVARPDNVAAGDLILLIFTQQRSSASEVSGFSVPTGFTLIRNEQSEASTERPEVVAFYKIAGPAEPTQYTSTVTNFGSVPNWKAIAGRVTGHDPWEPIGRTGGANSVANSVATLTVPQPPGVIYDSLLVAARTVRRSVSGENTPTGMTLEWSENGTGTADANTNAPAFRVATQAIAAPGVAGTRQFTWTGTARAAGLAFMVNRYRPESYPRINGLYFLSGDNNRYPSEPYDQSSNGSKMFVRYIDGMLHVALVVSARMVNDNVVSSVGAYCISAGWSKARTAKDAINSEYAEFTLKVGTGSGELDFNWYHGYAGGTGALGDDFRNQDWVSDTTVSGGTKMKNPTPPPGLISDSSFAWNMRNYARRLRSAVNPGWNMGTANSSNSWTSPITNPGNPTNVINAAEGYPAPGNGEVTFSPTYEWEWVMVYEWAVDLLQFVPQGAPVFVVTGTSHHSPGKTTNDDPFPPPPEEPLLDFGDLPAPYPTLLADNGPRHSIDPGGARLGSSLDSETNGQPHALARGDDLVGVDDEDGVVLLDPLVPGTAARFEITIGAPGYLSAFIDWDGNGTLDTVTATAITGPAAVATGVLGDTLFSAAGVYTVTVSVPANAEGNMPARFRITTTAGHGGNSPIGLAASGEVEDYLFRASIGDFVWLDADKDGIQDFGEVGIPGVTVELYRPGYGPDEIPGNADDAAVVDTTTTDINGAYGFADLPPGEYYVRVIPPNTPFTMSFSPQNQGGDPALDSDPDPLTGIMATTTLYPGEHDTTWDAGLYQKPTLAVISGVRSRVDGGVVTIEWDVELELGTEGYYLERWTADGWARVNATLLPVIPILPLPKTYALTDPGAPLSGAARYRVVELDGSGRLIAYGPYDLEIGGRGLTFEAWAAEIAWNGADGARDADPDRDGATNYQEWLAGTDPLSANSVLAVTAIEPLADGVRLRWTSVEGKSYALEMTLDLRQPFVAVATGIAATPPENTHVLPVDFEAVRNAFFRVRIGVEP